MENPIYLTDQELEAWHIRNFGAICIEEWYLFNRPSIHSDIAMRDYCIDLYHRATMLVVHED